MRLYFAGNAQGGLEDHLLILQTGGGRLTTYADKSQRRGCEKLFELMDIYFAGGENKAWLEAITRAGGTKSLYSYFYLNQGAGADLHMIRAVETQTKIFIDSGAFTAHTQGIDIDLGEYCDWLHKWKHRIRVYASLDVIGDWKGSLRNQREMEDRGLTPLWVFHQGSPFEVLEEMIQEYDYIAIGGLVGKRASKTALVAFLDRCFQILGKYWPKKAHAFGMTSVPLLQRYPFYSADSTSWLQGSRTGQLYHFTGRGFSTTGTSSQDEASHRTIHLTDNGDKRWKDRVIHNAQEWLKFERYLTELWHRRGITFPNDEIEKVSTGAVPRSGQQDDHPTP